MTSQKRPPGRGPRGRPVRRALAAAALLLAFARPAALCGQGRPIHFDRISTEEGLSQATVTCLLQDRVGFIWMCTQDGLNRYDGYDFVVYRNDPEDPRSLGNNWIMALVEDASGDLWVGTRGSGLYRWQRQHDDFVTYAHDPDDPASFAGDQVQALVPARGGGLWIGTDTSGVDRFDPATGTFRHYRHDPADATSLPDDQVRALLEDRAGRLWVGTFDGGLARLDGPDGRFTRFRHDPDDPGSLSAGEVRSIFEDRDGRVWIGTSGGLDRVATDRVATDRVDQATSTFEHFRHDPDDPASLSDNRVRGVFEDASGRLWIGSDAGLNVVDRDRREEVAFDRYFHDPTDAGSLPSDRTFAFLQDRGGVLWIGTQSGGVVRWDPRSWSFSNVPIRPSDLSGRDVLSFAEDGAGRLWIGTNGYGLNRLDRTTGELTHFRHDPERRASVGADHVTALLRDRDGALWIGTLTDGLSRLAAGDLAAGAADAAFSHFRHDPEDPESLSGDIVSALSEDRRGTLWVGTLQGLNRLDRATGAFTRFRHDPDDPESLSGDRVIAFAEDGEGFLWVGTLGAGLNRFDPSMGTAVPLRHDPQDPGSLSGDGVVSVHVDPAGGVWVGTQSGLNRLASFDESSGAAVFRRYLKPDGLPNEFIYGIESDGGGGLWLSTNQGLSRFDPRTETFKNYNTSHGLQADEFNFGAAYRSASGELFFGGINGFNAFFPDRIEVNDRPPPVVVTACSILNQPVDLGRPIFDLERLELGHRDSIVAFEFAALDFTAPGRNRYRYQLEGFSDEWIDLGRRRRVTFTNLDAGGYVLRVQGSNNDGVWNEEGAEIRLRVAAAPWLSWWAWVLYGLALAAGVFGFVRSQQSKVEREREVNRRLREVDELRGELLANLKQVVDERTEQVAERERLLAEVEAKNAELERFNYTVSHDLKSPLVTIKGFLGMLERDVEAGQQERARHDIRRIHAAASKMQQLLDELLHLSRLGHEAAEPVAVQLGEVVAEALEAVAGAVEERGVEVEVAADLPVVMGDQVRLRELFQNLLANAVKYMGEQPAPRVKIGLQWRGEETILYVRDNGSGIDPRYHDKIFGLFERLDTAEEGTGIGLALVQRIVQQHGGRVWVESEGAGHGSTFCFTLGSGKAGERPDQEPHGEGSKVVMASDRFRR